MGDSLSQMGPESNYHELELRDALEEAGVPVGTDALLVALEFAGVDRVELELDRQCSPSRDSMRSSL